MTVLNSQNFMVNGPRSRSPLQGLVELPEWRSIGVDQLAVAEEAQKCIQQGQIDKAISLLTRIFLEHPSEGVCHLLSHCYLIMGEDQEAGILRDLASSKVLKRAG